MRIDQLLYGYQNGHRLISSSLELTESENWELVRVTDRPSISESTLERGITFGFSLNPIHYALCRTWAANEISRPGAVWTHVLLLPKNIDSPLKYLSLLHAPTTPNESQFSNPKILDNPHPTSEYVPLSIEAANLLLILASKPQAGLRAICSTPSLELFSSAQNVWHELMHQRSFSTTSGKKNIVLDSGSIIVSSDETLADISGNAAFLNDSEFWISSSRISQAWKILHQDQNMLQNWLREIGIGIKQSTSNLKLVLETLLLGRNVLDDSKLLKRVTKAVGSAQDAPILRYSLGKWDGAIRPPPRWVAALFLICEEDWSKWNNLVHPESIGKEAASAPSIKLAECLTNISPANESRAALEELALSITPESFRTLYTISVDATLVLLDVNPELLFTLPKEARANRRLTSTSRAEGHNLTQDLNRLESVPFWWRNVVADGIRRNNSEKILIQFALGKVKKGEWNSQAPAIRKFLKSTPTFLDKLLCTEGFEDSTRSALKEFGSTQVFDAFSRLALNSDSKEKIVANKLIEIVGPEGSITFIRKYSRKIDPKFFAALADARWRKSNSLKVLDRIKSEVNHANNLEHVVEYIQSKNLKKSLIEPKPKKSKKLVAKKKKHSKKGAS